MGRQVSDKSDREFQYRSSRSHVLYKKVVLKKITKFTGKHLCQDLLLKHLQYNLPRSRMAPVIMKGVSELHENIQSQL